MVVTTPHSLEYFEGLFEEKMSTIGTSEDPAHDLSHFKRVVQVAKKLCAEEKANLNIVVPAAWLHDFVIVPKDSPLRSQASFLAAEQASLYLKNIGYDRRYIPEIAKAIEGHSFTANIEVNTIEAKIVQDADRLDGLGAIGIARCFATAGLMKRTFYSEEDPFCIERTPNDNQFTLDHFYKKLFKIVDTMKTKSGRSEAQRRADVMKFYLKALEEEIPKLMVPELLG